MKKLQTFKELSDISILIKRYASYLINKYCLINKYYVVSGIYYELYNFCKNGKIKGGLINKNDKYTTKIEIIEYYRNDIFKFARDHDLEIEIYTFEEFLKNKYPKKYADYLIYKDAEKYNLL